MFLTAFYGLWVTYDKTVTRPNVTGFNRFWPVAVRLWVYCHIRQPFAVLVTQNWAEKPDLTGLLNTTYLQLFNQPFSHLIQPTSRPKIHQCEYNDVQPTIQSSHSAEQLVEGSSMWIYWFAIIYPIIYPAHSPKQLAGGCSLWIYQFVTNPSAIAFSHVDVCMHRHHLLQTVFCTSSLNDAQVILHAIPSLLLTPDRPRDVPHTCLDTLFRRSSLCSHAYGLTSFIYSLSYYIIYLSPLYSHSYLYPYPSSGPHSFLIGSPAR